MRTTIAKRPTFAEAGSNPYFRARRDTTTDHYGRTADLRRLAAGEPQIEGLPEILIGVELMTTQFKWKYISKVGVDVPTVDPIFFERLLVDLGFFERLLVSLRHPDHACDQAIAELERLAK
jgi:hypothetical protein